MIDRKINWSIDQSINPSINWTINRLIKRSMNRLIDPSIHRRWIFRLMDWLINWLINQSNDQSPINPSIDQKQSTLSTGSVCVELSVMCDRLRAFTRAFFIAASEFTSLKPCVTEPHCHDVLMLCTDTKQSFGNGRRITEFNAPFNHILTCRMASGSISMSWAGGSQ